MWVYCGETNLFFFIPLVLLLCFPHTKAECLSPHKTIRCSVYTYPVTHHFINRRGAASLRHRNRAATTVLVFEQKPYRVLFSWQRERYSEYCEHNFEPRSPEAKEKRHFTFQRETVRSGYEIKVIYPGGILQRCFNFSIINCIFPLKEWS